MGMSLLEHRRNEEILEEAKVEPIAMVGEGGGWNGSATLKEDTKLKIYQSRCRDEDGRKRLRKRPMLR